MLNQWRRLKGRVNGKTSEKTNLERRIFWPWQITSCCQKRGSGLLSTSRLYHTQWGAEISFCLTIDHCRTILYYSVLHCTATRPRLFTLLFRPGSLTGSQTLTMVLDPISGR